MKTQSDQVQERKPNTFASKLKQEREKGLCLECAEPYSNEKSMFCDNCRALFKFKQNSNNPFAD